MNDEQTTNDDLNDHAVERAMREDNDPVNYPKHYRAHPSGVECITIVEHFNFNRGNAMKYIWRAGEKADEIEDLQKAAWYIQREVERLTRDRNVKDVHVAASPEAVEEVLRKEREDVGFALTDAEAAEAERAVAAGRLAGYVPKPRPDGREHLPTSYELDRAESIAERLRQEKQEQGEKLAELADQNEWLAEENERLGEANERLRRAVEATDLERELRSRAEENCKIAERERADAVRSMMVAVEQIDGHARRRCEAEMAAEAHAKENARLTAENQELRAAMSLAQDQEAARTRAAVRSATLVLADEVTALKKQLLESGRG